MACILAIATISLACDVIVNLYRPVKLVSQSWLLEFRFFTKLMHMHPRFGLQSPAFFCVGFTPRNYMAQVLQKWL